MFSILQNSPYFCVFKYVRAVKQKVWNDADNRERETYATLYRFLYSFWEKKNPTVLQSTCSFLYIHVRFYHPEKRSPHCKKGRNPSLGFWIQHCGFRIPDTWFLIFCQWNLNFVFQLLAGFRIPWAGIRDSKATISYPTNKKFPYSMIPRSKTSRIPDPTSKNFPYFGSHKQNSCIPDPKSKNFPYCGIWITLPVAKKGVYISRLIHF